MRDLAFTAVVKRRRCAHKFGSFILRAQLYLSEIGLEYAFTLTATSRRDIAARART
jgi:hypothetical protein